ncbi:MAG: hypothetical protein BWY73_00602 [candidate division TA06 bacterium ADurb.Bin417]|uniref:Uncharacterized protein n=1 Tax=candidate division TA06 bacterium ADurb.Bin417 TaxID=1852828 RepID=A0A1V5MHX6_UNCT6|nr:MAG: hypothetical protein BWY73_00602 [candidate division TA06 bacterium ADurb.Bin417]
MKQARASGVLVITQLLKETCRMAPRLSVPSFSAEQVVSSRQPVTTMFSQGCSGLLDLRTTQSSPARI